MDCIKLHSSETFLLIVNNVVKKKGWRRAFHLIQLLFNAKREKTFNNVKNMICKLQ